MLPSMGLKIGGFLTLSGVAALHSLMHHGCSDLVVFHIAPQQMELMRRKDKGHRLTICEITL